MKSVVIFFLMIMPCALTLLSYLGPYHWILDLTTHFHLQYLLCLVLGLLIAVFSIRSWWLVIPVLFLIPNVMEILPLYQSPPHTNQVTSAPPLKLLHMNLWIANNNANAVLKTIQEKNPDVISFNEYFPHWSKALDDSEVLKAYPYRRHDNDVGIFSKLPLINLSYTVIGIKSAYTAEVDLGNQPLKIIMTHTVVPIGDKNCKHQHRHFAWIANEVKQSNMPVVFVGDLNTTPWSSPMKQFIKDSGLKNSMAGFGLQTTWPSVFGPIGIPIDHVMITPDLAVTKHTTGPFIYSDHLPVYVEIKTR